MANRNNKRFGWSTGSGKDWKSHYTDSVKKAHQAAKAGMSVHDFWFDIDL